MKSNSSVWKSEKLARTFLEGIRKSIPLANEQIEIIQRIILKWKPEVKTFLDLGCGDGVLGQAVLTVNRNAKGVFLDISDKMLKTAREKCQNNRVRFVKADFEKPDWVRSITRFGSFDLVVSGFSIHHQTDKRKKEVYKEVYDILAPGGIFLNLEHVSSPSKDIESLFDEYFTDSLYAYHSKSNRRMTKEKIEKEYYNRADKVANILLSVESQCNWLRDIGFRDVDCFFKVFELALFGGRKQDKKKSLYFLPSR